MSCKCNGFTLYIEVLSWQCRGGDHGRLAWHGMALCGYSLVAREEYAVIIYRATTFYGESGKNQC